jgi:nucleoside-diphosphate-sugar epimerase
MTGRGSFGGRRVLVTGASGFIGTHLTARLLAEGAEVHGISRSERATAGMRWVTTDMTDAQGLAAAVAGIRPDVVFHLASHVTGSRDVEAVLPTLNDNLVGAVNLLLAASTAGCRRVILTGSLEEPGGEEPEPDPVSPYAAAKFAASAYGRMFHRLYGLAVVNLRVFMVYGPGQQDERRLVPYVITSLLRNSPPRLSSGAREVDWVYVDDVVDAFLAAAVSDGAAGETLDVGSGALVTVRGLVEQIVHVMEPGVNPEFGALPDRAAERVRVADVGRTTRLTGWSPKTPLDEGIASTIEWFSSRGDR